MINCKHVFAMAIVGLRQMPELRTALDRDRAITAGNKGDGRAALTPVPDRPAQSEPARTARPAVPHLRKTPSALRGGTHSVGLPPSRPSRGARNLPEAAQPAPWMRSISALLADGQSAKESPGDPLGLQVELTRIGQPSAQRGSGALVSQVRVGLRPMLLGAKGNWIRTGIAWDKLGSYNYQRQQRPRADHVQLLRDISTLNSATHGYYGYNHPFVYLESMNSRRIWDILAEARNIGMALIQSGKGQPPVTLADDRAEIVLEIKRDDSDLVIEPAVSLNGHSTGPVNFALLGTPLHGLALWPQEPDADLNSSGLMLVPCEQRLAPELRQFVTEGRVRIPGRDAETFLRDYLPQLSRRVSLLSRDDSLVIPEPEPPILSLTVNGLPGHRVSLAWEWRYAFGGSTTTLPLWPSGRESLPRDSESERSVLESLALTEEDMLRLMEPGQRGPRLTSAVTLEGLHAIAFFGETLPRLRDLPNVNLTVINEQSYREAVEAPVISISNSQSAQDHDWFDLGITVAIDGEDVPFNDLFLALAAADSHMILPSGTYFSLDCEPFLTLRTLIEEARALQDVPGRSVRINRYQAALWDELQDLGVITSQAAAWKKSVGGLLAGDQIMNRPVPDSLRATLRPYQQSGFNWLAFLFDHDLGGVLADDMGLGKTIQTLALICHARSERPDTPPFLVVSPTSVVGNWAAECRKFAPDLRVVAVTETLTRGGVDLATMVAQADIVVTSYALFRLDFDDYSQQDWSGLILDEAQFIKNHLAKGHHCAKKLSVPFKLAITGTPMENNLMELWSLFSVTSPGLFSQAARFKEYYQTPIERSGDSERLAQLRRRIRPLMLRRTKEQVATDLPAKQEQVVEMELNPKHRKVYQTHLQRERQKVLGLIDDMTKNRFAIFRSLTLLRQLSLDASLVDDRYANIPSTKLDALMEQVEDVVAEGHRTLIFSQFTGFLDKVRQRIDKAGIEYCYLDGTTRNRPAVLTEFKSGKAPVFLISLKAGGFGLNLTEADYCILLDPWWNPATEEQAVDRVHRIGQTKNVMVYRLVAKDTIEEKVMALKATKAKLFSSVMDSGSAQATALTAADIRELLS
jgi:superfamily II DNA or RNA helicase